ncbi:MAG TPA: Hpt domain-containing protein [Myxococcota bacterium]|nr:Hpt domain-containing protein [Myxococcota bacterium]
MKLDLAKYRTLFLEEGSEHLAELSRALLELEKDAGSPEAIDAAFRMAHSIKGMAASLGYESIAEVAHRFEDRMARYRAAGRVDSAGVGVLFQGLDGLERMLGCVRETGEAPAAEARLTAALAASDAAAVPEVQPEKKVLRS